MCKVSIIIPIYNVDRYLERCLDSVIGQTLNDIEIILVNDCSPDRSIDICLKYKAKDERIKIVDKSVNEGLGLARNSGLEVANGEYVAFIDSDDFIESSMFDKLYSNAIQGNSDVVFCGFRRELLKEKYKIVQECKESTTIKGTELVKGCLLDFVACAPYVNEERKFSMSVWHSIYRRDIIVKNKIKFLSERKVGSEDLPFQVDFMMNSNVISFIPDVLYFYCYNGTSLTKTFSNDKFLRYKELYFTLKSKLVVVDLNYLRCSRFIIGYIRSHILEIVKANIPYKTKLQFISEICEDNIWDELKENYSYKYLPRYQSIFYRLILTKNIQFIYLLSLLVSQAKFYKLKWT